MKCYYRNKCCALLRKNIYFICICALFYLIFVRQLKYKEDYSTKFFMQEKIQYTMPHKTAKLYFSGDPPRGKDFLPDVTSKAQLGFPLQEFCTLSDDVLKEFVFVTGGSDSFYFNLEHAVLSIKKHFPGKTIIVYNLGLESYQLKRLSGIEDVSLKTFNFAAYPEHVAQLFFYAWKPLIIHEMLKLYSGILWVDSSAIITSGNMTATYMDVRKTNGITLIRNTGHSIFAVTHHKTYDYLPSVVDNLKKVQQREAGSILIYRTEEIYSNIIAWWTLCALERDCIAPISNRGCTFGKNWWTYYANCHRFDQSAINIILANYFNFDDMFYKSTEEILTIKR